ncbi:MAG: hypothetical protein IPK67_18425 [Planctomycetes bacterium]|nr:hypothetical protein [Planctomycetota bacterium]
MLTDDGIVGGYGYSEGLSGRMGAGDLILAVVSTQGRTVGRYAIQRHSRSEEHELDTPVARGIMYQAERRLFVVRVSGGAVRRSHEKWWLLDSSTGECVGVVDPLEKVQSNSTLRQSLGACEIRGTPLILAHWYSFDDHLDSRGARFIVYDKLWAPVWILELPAVYDEVGAINSVFPFGSSTMGVSSDSTGEFSIRVAGDNARRTFRVIADSSFGPGWRVVEVDG